MNYYKRAALRGHVGSMYLYADKLYFLNSKEHLQESFRMFKKSSDKGNIQATFRCGIMLINGEGIPSDVELGSMYLKIAADEGHPKACEQYANLLRNGIIISADPNKATEYYLKAISKNNSEAAYNYGKMLENVRSVTLDYFRVFL